MYNGTTEQQFVADDKESPGKEPDDDADDDNDDDDDDDDADDQGDNDDDNDVNRDEIRQPQQPDTAMEHWTPVTFASLPDWMRDNELILSGHRPQLQNFYSCLVSVFRIHSETGNIWTHLIGHHHHVM